MKLTAVAPDLYLIPLDQDIPGFVDFIGSWVVKGPPTFLVDAGPAATVPRLLESLAQLDVQHLDAILLTHIHIDHAGGLGDVIAHFPDTPVICHPGAIKHLADPTRLWEGSLKNLGAIARSYGPIRAVPAALLQDATHYREHGIRPLLTPGHAAHHVSYQFGPFLFAGETVGVHAGFDDGRVYLRPATPPRLFLETYLQSVDLILDTPHDVLCYGHYGITRRTPDLIRAHRRQILIWRDVVGRQMRQGQGEDFVDRCIERLLAEDDLMAAWDRFTPDVQERERAFLTNSVRGFAEYLNRTDMP